MATPFTDGGALDLDGLPRLVEWALETGITASPSSASPARRIASPTRSAAAWWRRWSRRCAGGCRWRWASRPPAPTWPRRSRAWRRSTAPSPHGGAAHRLEEPRRGARVLPRGGAATALPIVLQDEPVTTQVTMPAPFIAQRVRRDRAGSRRSSWRSARPCPRSRGCARSSATGWRSSAGWAACYFFEELSRGADGAMTGFPYPEALRAIRDALRGRPARRGARALLPVAAADPVREPARRHARHLGGHPQGDPPPPRLDRLRAGAAARAGARRGPRPSSTSSSPPSCR